uniref:Putative secreted protein ovary overexpressed n=1 Tax=Rhipicephalus microplus TaxID=6941 RepID=A0A6M2D9G3_RHIMP
MQVRLGVVRPLQALGTAVGLVYGTEANTQVNTPAGDVKAARHATVRRFPKGTRTKETRAYQAPTNEGETIWRARDSASLILATPKSKRRAPAWRYLLPRAVTRAWEKKRSGCTAECP